MVIVFEGTKNQYSLDGILKQNLDTAKEVIKKDWDFIFIVDGYEGSGKSVFAQQMAYYLDPSLTIERIAFTPDEFQKAILNAQKFEAVVYDEAYTGLSSRDTMSKINKALVKMLAEIRQKNLYVFVVMPSFFDLDKYVAIWRSRALLHVYTASNFQRGFFRFYNIDRKKELYVQGKKYYRYIKGLENFYGRFTNHYCVDEQEYREKKRKALKIKEKKEEMTYREQINKRDQIIVNMREQGMTQKDIADMIGLSQQVVSRTLKKYTRIV